MTKTAIYKERVQAIRKELLTDIYLVMQGTKTQTIKFTATQAPRFYFDGQWREIIMLKQGFFAGACSITFGWHDERCGSNGANAFVSAASLSTETLLQCHELIFGSKE